MTPTVSVVIPTRNRAHDLGNVLSALAAQSLDDDQFEVVVVDNGSTDATAEVVASLSLQNLTLVTEPIPGLHAGRNRALAESRAPLLLFGDDDIIPTHGWVEAVRDAFADESVGLVTGPVRPRFDHEPPEWVADLKVAVPGGWYIGEYSLLELENETREIQPGLVFGCNFGVRRELIESVRGFPPDALPEPLLRFRGDGETGAAERIAGLGYRAVYAPGAAVVHRVASSRLALEYVEHRSFKEGVLASYRAVRRSGRAAKPLSPELLRLRIRGLAQTLRGPEVSRRRSRGYIRGYLWHQAEVARDPTLLDWVQRADYRGHAGDPRGSAA